MSSKTNIKEKDNTKKLCIFLAFFIPLTVALIALYSGGFAPFGKRDVLTSGGFEKYRYLLNDLHDRLRDGASSNSGLISAQGYDSGSAWAYYLSDPTNLLTVLFPKEDMSAVLNILYAFKLALAGLFFYIFLCSRKRYEEEAKLANEKERSGIISIYNEKKNAKKTKKLIEKYGAENAEAHRFDVRFGGSENPSSKLGQFLKKFDILSLALSVTYALSAYMMGSGLNVTLLGPVVIFPLIMLGLLKLESGQILADGKDALCSENYRKWLKNIGYIPQTVFMLDDTIRKNVAFGIPEDEIDENRVWEVLKEAQLDEFVKGLPNGLETGIGERGIRLSGGQRQRISIARALYEDPEVLVLDEATSALDGDTEQAIMDSVNSLHGRKTLIIIAHRLQTIEKCDAVYRIENGKANRER